MSTVAAVTVPFAQGWFFVALFAAVAVAMVIAHRRATSIPEAMTSLQDLGVLAGQLLCLSMVFSFCWGADYLTTSGLLPGSLTDRVSAGVSGAALAAIAVGSARGALQCAPALLSRRNVGSAHPLNAVAVVATWTALWVLACAVLAPVVTVLTTFAVTVGAVLTLAVFFIGVAAVRLRSLLGLVGELAAALDAYYVALTDTATVGTGSEREAYLDVDRLMHLRPVGLMFAAPRKNAEHAVRLGLLFIGESVTRVRTNVHPEHQHYLHTRLSIAQDLRREAAEFVRYLRSGLLRDA